MLGAAILIAVVLAIVGVAVWSGRGGETKGKAGNSTGVGSWWPW